MADSHGDSDELTGKHLQMGVWGSQPCLMEEWEELIIKNHPEAGSRTPQDESREPTGVNIGFYFTQMCAHSQTNLSMKTDILDPRVDPRRIFKTAIDSTKGTNPSKGETEKGRQGM